MRAPHAPRRRSAGRCLYALIRQGQGTAKALGNVGGLAKHLALVLDDDGTGFEADANSQLRTPIAAFRALTSPSACWNTEGGPNSAFGVILLRARIAKNGHHPIAEYLQYVGSEPVAAFEASLR